MLSIVLLLAAGAVVLVGRGDKTPVAQRETIDGDLALPGGLDTPLPTDADPAISARKSVSGAAAKPTTTLAPEPEPTTPPATVRRASRTAASGGGGGGDAPSGDAGAAPPAPVAKPTNGGTTKASGWQPTGPAYVVDPAGDDNNPGTEDAPWRTIAVGISRLSPGDSLLVRDGTYGTAGNGNAINIQNVNGAPNAPITVAAYPGQRPVLLGGGYQVVRIFASTYVDLRGFDIQGTAGSDREGTSGIEVSNSHHVRVLSNQVHDVGGGGINTIDSNHITLDGNEVWNTSRWNPLQTSGISLFTSKNIGGGNNGDGFSFYVRNNIVHDVQNPDGGPTDGNCIIVDSNRNNGYGGSTLIANNLCYDNGGRGVHVFISDNVTAVNNTLVRNQRNNAFADQGELSAANASNVVFRNNLVVPLRDGRGVREWQASNVVYDHNLYVGSPPERTSPTDITVADAIGSNFMPFDGSAAINAGTTTDAPSHDIRGRSRSGAPDIGAYEVG